MTRPVCAAPTRPVGSIRIGTRYRREPGDLRALADSIDEDGLLHPVVIRPNGDLVAGWRRLQAWEMSRHRGRPIPVHVVDIDAIARGELTENTLRKDLTPSEAVALMRALQPALGKLGRERQIVLGRTHGADDIGPPHLVGQLAPRHGVGIRTRDVIASLVGRSDRSLRKAEAVVAAAEAEPERFGRLVQAMDRSGKVDGPFRRLTVMRQAAAIRAAPPPLPGRGPYRVGVIDPPWPFDDDRDDPSERATHPYPQMSYAQIAAMPVAKLFGADSALWLWTTNHHLPHAYAILSAYGFAPRTMLTWVKDRFGRGHYLREQTEHAIVAIRGRPLFDLTNETTVLHAPRGAHSEKPAAFYGLVERLCPVPAYAELFSHHQTRPGWDSHSTEIAASAPAASAEAAA